MGFRRSWTLGACFALLLAALLPVSADAGSLPIGKEHVDPDRLPLPFGAGLTIYSQSQEYRIADLSFDTPLLGPIDTGGIGIDNQLDEINLKLDAWIFPFLNVFGIIGDLDGTTKVGLSQLELAVPLGDLTIHYDGEVYGGGITLAYGGERLWGSITGIFTETNVSGEFESEVQAFILTPKFGLQIGRGAVWIGAMLQQAEEKHSGTITLPFLGAVPFAVDLEEKDEWNLLAGAAAPLSEHWTLELEGGAAGRDSASLALTYRF
ncbi:MAG: hypothetical protein KDD47_13145 [Acidobacteria bacterium]|nr:hypothetical protein [Acidobacteriota bacterium]